MLSQINAAFADSPDDAEKENTKRMQRVITLKVLKQHLEKLT
jgi:hypothetical protein